MSRQWSAGRARRIDRTAVGNLVILGLLTGCLGRSSAPVGVAKSFMDGAIAHDFDAVKGFYAADQQPKDWSDVIQGWPWVGEPSECKGVGYRVVERKSPITADAEEISIVYQSDCILMDYYGMEPRESDMNKRANTVTIDLERIGDRWYVSYASAPTI